jgi:hypothetical protein
MPSALEGGSLVYVRKWVQTKNATLFCFTDEAIQVNFQDATSVLLSAEGRHVTYLDKKGALSTQTLAGVRSPEVVERLTYTREMLREMIKPQ